MLETEHTILVRIGGARGVRMGYDAWLAYKDEQSLSRDTSVPQRITTHGARSAETITTTWYSADGTLRVVTRETCAI